MNKYDSIVRIILQHYPTTQAIYLFGSFGTADEWPTSDVDIAVLLPPTEARHQSQLMLTPCHYALEGALNRSVDLVNGREVSTVFQKEIIRSGRRIYTTDDTAVAEFEMLTLSYYQKLNEERAAILQVFRETGKAYAASAEWSAMGENR
ncbi:MAG: nucleotidyltransferase domain-containing protein [Anaerolineae bacterium]